MRNHGRTQIKMRWALIKVKQLYHRGLKTHAHLDLSSLNNEAVMPDYQIKVKGLVGRPKKERVYT
jgi:hypothetical protein